MPKIITLQLRRLTSLQVLLVQYDNRTDNLKMTEKTPTQIDLNPADTMDTVPQSGKTIAENAPPIRNQKEGRARHQGCDIALIVSKSSDFIKP